jgi:hypothetical protein
MAAIGKFFLSKRHPPPTLDDIYQPIVPVLVREIDFVGESHAHIPKSPEKAMSGTLDDSFGASREEKSVQVGPALGESPAIGEISAEPPGPRNEQIECPPDHHEGYEILSDHENSPLSSEILKGSGVIPLPLLRPGVPAVSSFFYDETLDGNDAPGSTDSRNPRDDYQNLGSTDSDEDGAIATLLEKIGGTLDESVSRESAKSRF